MQKVYYFITAIKPIHAKWGVKEMWGKETEYISRMTPKKKKLYNVNNN